MSSFKQIILARFAKLALAAAKSVLASHKSSLKVSILSHTLLRERLEFLDEFPLHLQLQSQSKLQF